MNRDRGDFVTEPGQLESPPSVNLRGRDCKSARGALAWSPPVGRGKPLAGAHDSVSRFSVESFASESVVNSDYPESSGAGAGDGERAAAGVALRAWRHMDIRPWGGVASLVVMRGCSS